MPAMICAAMALALVIPAAALAQVMPIPAKQSDICKSDDDDDDDKPVPLWKRFAWEGACFDVSGQLSAVYQKQKNSGSRIPILTTRQGGLTNASELVTFDASIRVDTTRKTPIGDLKTGFEVQYEKTTVDGGNGIATLIEGIVTWAGFKGGYTDSQMNFWSGDFQFSATAPQRTVGLAGYEFKLNDAWTFTLAYETGLPSSQAGASDFVTVYPKDPVASAKLYYEKDDAEFQLAGMVHELHIDGTHPRLAFLRHPQSSDAFGWATTAGLTLPVKWGEDGSAFSMQATYAVNASPYLGTVADLSTLASLVGVPVTTKGWSIVGSYHHVFSDHWEANAMASYLALDIAMDRQSPSIRTNRYAANLIYKPDDKLKLGAEVGYVKADIDSGGPIGLLGLGLFNPVFFNDLLGGSIASAANASLPLPRINTGPRSVNGSGLAGYLFATWSF